MQTGNEFRVYYEETKIKEMVVFVSGDEEVAKARVNLYLNDKRIKILAAEKLPATLAEEENQ